MTDEATKNRAHWDADSDEYQSLHVRQLSTRSCTPPISACTGATTTYEGFVTYEWARRWPAENVWVVRKKA